jgi:hypothetical protein
MDQNQQTATNNQIINDFNVTVKVDPSTLPQAQVNDDLAALKSAEELMTGKSAISSPTLNTPKPKPISTIRSNQPQELRALQLKNPFRGE